MIMLRRRPPALAQIYSTLINHRQWAPRLASVRFVGTSSEGISCASCAPAFSPLHHHVGPITVRYSSIIINHNSNDINNDTNDFHEKGEECYKLAMEALNNASRVKQKHEERLLQEQFDAMDQQRQKTQQRKQQRRQSEGQQDPRLQMGSEGDAKDRAAGVAVVRTIVKQSNAVLVEKYDSSSQLNTNVKKGSNAKKANKLDDEEHWQQIAKKHMEESAFRYGHSLALVRLGNEALERAKKDDSVSTALAPLFDRERSQEWINESPINLAGILELSANVEGNNVSDDEDSLSPYLKLALNLYEEAGKQGSAEGWYNLGHLHWDAPDNHTYASKEEAMNAFHKAMELGDADAMYFVAAQYLSYEESEGADGENFLSMIYEQYGPAFITSLQSKDVSQMTDQLELSNTLQQHGYKLLHHAAHQHKHGPALHHLALLHNQHDNTEEFHKLLSKAASTGNPDSLFLQGHCSYFGTDGYKQNFPTALENFLAAAETGHVDAMVSAGATLHQGIVSKDGRVIVERDQQRAFDLYQQAGELGSVEGWRNVVSCYATGQGVPKCVETAKYIANTMLKEVS